MIYAKAKSKTVSRHRLRRRADERCSELNEAWGFQRRYNSVAQQDDWLRRQEAPDWTSRFEVRRARLRFHYRVVAVER